jgi:Glycosyl hydrolase family 26
MFAQGALARPAGDRPRGLGEQFAVDPQPRAKTHSPRSGETVSGRIRWRVSFHGPRPKRIDLAVDGVVKIRLIRPRRHGRLSRRVGVATLDTTSLSNGRHVLTAIGYGVKRRHPQKSTVTVTVENSPEPRTPAHGPASVYWGAWIGDHLTGHEAPWDMNAVRRFEAMAGKQPSIIQFGSPFADCTSNPCSYYSFPWTPFNDIRSYGAIPFLSWSSQSLPSGLHQPDYQLSDLISGAHDDYIRSFARKAREWGKPFFMRFNWEMNGNWFSWSEGVNGNRPGEYVAAWRHVHDIFRSVGATNAAWVWCPNIDPNDRLQDLRPLYPGDAYVDWTCLDGYNWGTNRAGVNPTSPRVWRSFDQLYRSTYEEIVQGIAPSKPMIIGEIGSSDHGGSKAAWIEDMLATVPTYSKIRGLLWFERFDNNMDWPLETSATATGAFASGIGSSAYTTNTFGHITASPILPPG